MLTMDNKVLWILIFLYTCQIAAGVANPSSRGEAVGGNATRATTSLVPEDDFYLPGSGDPDDVDYVDYEYVSPQSDGATSYRTAPRQSTGNTETSSAEIMTTDGMMNSDDGDLSFASGDDQAEEDTTTESDVQDGATVGNLNIAVMPVRFDVVTMGSDDSTDADPTNDTGTDAGVLLGQLNTGKEDITKLPVFAIAMAALTSGIVFFALGFFCRRRVNKYQYHYGRSPYNYKAVPAANGGSRGRYPRGSASGPGGDSGATSPCGSHIELRIIGPDEDYNDDANSKEDSLLLSDGGNMNTVSNASSEEKFQTEEQPDILVDTTNKGHQVQPQPSPVPSSGSPSKPRKIWNFFKKEESDDEEEDIDAIVAEITATNAAKAASSSPASPRPEHIALHSDRNADPAKRDDESVQKRESPGTPTRRSPSPSVPRSPQAVTPPSSPWQTRTQPQHSAIKPDNQRKPNAEPKIPIIVINHDDKKPDYPDKTDSKIPLSTSNPGGNTTDNKIQPDSAKPGTASKPANSIPENEGKPQRQNSAGEGQLDSKSKPGTKLPQKEPTPDTKIPSKDPKPGTKVPQKETKPGSTIPQKAPYIDTQIPQMDPKRRFQSPINIVTSSVQCDAILQRNPLAISYSAAESTFIKNTGYTIKISFDSDSAIKGGPLAQKTFRLDHALLHWGDSDGCGSEHTLDGSTYAGELQLVHWNPKLYRNIEEASTHMDGLAIIAVFMKIGNRPHSAMDKITRNLSRVSYKGQLTEVEDVLSPSDFLPGNMANYWTYAGSLTAEPYSESVTWVVVRDPIVVSRQQMRSLRCLYAHDMLATRSQQRCMVDNFRSPQPLEDRKVKASFL